MAQTDSTKNFPNLNFLHSDTPLHVNSLRVLGSGSTRSSFLNRLTAGIFQASTLEEVISSVQDASGKLRRLDIFSDIQVTLDTAADTTDAVDVVLQLKEKGKTVISTTADIANDEANLNGNFVLRNLFGGAETFGTTVEFGNRNKAAFKSFLSTPIGGSPDIKLSAHINGRLRDNSVVAAYEEFNRNVGVKVKGISNYGFHELGYDVTWRDTMVKTGASSLIKGFAGQSLKTAITHSFVRDRRDNPILPTEGHLVSIYNEIAGVVGSKSDSKYFKKEIAVQQHLQLLNPTISESGLSVPRLVLSGGLRGGLLYNLNEIEPHISDRFVLGGPTSVRGFKIGGIGPRDGDDAVGGEAYWAAGLSAVAPIPGMLDLPLKAHAFVNAGNLIKWKKGTSYEDTRDAMLMNPRVSYGVGVIFHHPAARIEANFCFPVQFFGGDLEQAGVQFGFGVNFL